MENAIEKSTPAGGANGVEYANALGNPTFKQDKDNKKLSFSQLQVILDKELAKVFEGCAKVVPESGWRKAAFDWQKETARPQPLFNINGKMVLSRENICVLTGLPKTAKTTLAACICAAVISQSKVLEIEGAAPGLKVLLCDTEQAPWHLRQECQRIADLSGKADGWNTLFLRRYAPEERLNIIIDCAEELHPDFIVIDGAADLITDCNDMPQSKALIDDLCKIASEYKCGILAVVHSNPGGGEKVRGHLGSELERKCEYGVILEKLEDGETFRVRPKDTRNALFQGFSFRFGSNGLPELCTAPEKPHTLADKMLDKLEMGKGYTHSELIAICQGFGASESSAKQTISKEAAKGHITKDEKLWYYSVGKGGY